MKDVHIRLDDEMYSDMKYLAEVNGVSDAAVIRSLFTQQYKELKNHADRDAAMTPEERQSLMEAYNGLTVELNQVVRQLRIMGGNVSKMTAYMLRKGKETNQLIQPTMEWADKFTEHSERVFPEIFDAMEHLRQVV
jgi:hypothetical protein